MNSHVKSTLILAAGLGALAVALGAFGAHALKAILVENNRVDTFELANRYHFYHTLALLGLGLIRVHVQSRLLSWAIGLLVTGTILFSGSLYWLSLTNQTAVAMITPVGGVLMIFGWLAIAFAVLNQKKS